jgi:DNA polymerase elongation subunit (family B)
LSDWKKSCVKLNPVRGWLFDVYPSGSDEVAVWIIAENGERIRFVDRFVQKIFVSGDFPTLNRLVEKIRDDSSVAFCRFVEKNADFMKNFKQKVLEIGINDYAHTSRFARELKLAGYERLRAYNVDVPVSQAYLYDKDVFPLAHLMVVDSGKQLYYHMLDSVESVDYHIPPLRSSWLRVNAKKQSLPHRLADKIDSLSLESDGKTITIDEGSEAEKIQELVRAVKEHDPDLIFTDGGDSFSLLYLAYRAFVNGVLKNFVLSRDAIPLKASKGQGTTFFSYGRVYHRAPTRRLFGRVHIDVSNTFIYTACGLNGLVEVSRTCRVPLHQAARASIGTIMSSLQLYTAWKDGILIPWKKNEPESFKTAWELLVADRGGFIFEPKLGFHADVFEVDFTSMFPMLMWKRNISAETVLCKCCPNSSLRVPELGYNICEKRRGIVPKTLDLLLKKRLRYKGLMREAEDESLKHAYNMRQGALKWILVTCFGYLGYRNARFGKVDAHIAVCAFARDSLLKTARLAEQRGFEVIHGIVDSLWLKKPKVSPREVADFCREASAAIDVPLGVEGKYRWIVFLPSKVLEEVPVLNRYYGVFDNGNIKLRGVEARRKDTSVFVAKAQMDMIRKVGGTNSLENFKEKIPHALRVLRDYADRLVRGDVDVDELLVTKRLSKCTSGYSHDVFQAIAARQLEKAGFEVHAGQTVQYLIVNAKSKWVAERVVAAQLLKPNMRHDVKEYVKLLVSAGETLFGVFGYSKSRIQAEAFYNEKQIVLDMSRTERHERALTSSE